MKVCVYGAGAVGGYLAAQLAGSADHEVSVIARGAHLAAIRERGLTLTSATGTKTVRFAHATDDPAELPPQDMIFVTLKAHTLPDAAAAIGRLLAPDGVAVFAHNGVPWWWNHDHTNEVQGAPRTSKVDPDGKLWLAVGPQRALGCVLYSMNEVTAPGEVVHRGNNRWILGEPDNSLSPRLARAVQLLTDVGMNAEASPDLRLQIWRKLLRNATMNPLCALTRLDAGQAVAQPRLLGLAHAVASEVVSVARSKGWDLSDDLVAEMKFLDGTATNPTSGKRIQGIKPSMLQDILAGRPLEVEAVLGQLNAFAREEQVATPALDAVLALAAGLSSSQQTATA